MIKIIAVVWLLLPFNLLKALENPILASFESSLQDVTRMDGFLRMDEKHSDDDKYLLSQYLNEGQYLKTAALSYFLAEWKQYPKMAVPDPYPEIDAPDFLGFFTVYVKGLPEFRILFGPGNLIRIEEVGGEDLEKLDIYFHDCERILFKVCELQRIAFESNER